ARHDGLDQAVHHGLAAFSHDRKTKASLLSHAADLDQLLNDRCHDERLADDFTSDTAMPRSRYAKSALRQMQQLGIGSGLKAEGRQFGPAPDHQFGVDQHDSE